MKKHMIAATACSLALLLGIAPVLAACGGNADTDDDAAIVLPDQDTQFPELPEETLPEEPALPDDETQPESPEVPEETPEQPEPEPDVPAVSLHAEYVLVNTNGLNVRRGAGTSHPSLGQVDRGDMLHLAGKKGDWYETRYRGGTAYVNAVPAVEKLLDETEGDEKTGVRIIAKALTEPMRQIATNAGIDGSVVLENVKKADKTGYGFDAYNETYVDMISAGIVDPTKVTRSALENAASIASTLLTTEALVADKPQPPAPAAPAVSASMT